MFAPSTCSISTKHGDPLVFCAEMNLTLRLVPAPGEATMTVVPADAMARLGEIPGVTVVAGGTQSTNEA
jgi:hypothetical protein